MPIDSQTSAALIGSASTILAALLAGAAVVFQIGKQAQHAREQQAHAERLRLQMRIYESVSDVCDRVIEAGVSFSTYAELLPFHLRNALHHEERGLSMPPIPQRWAALQDRFDGACRAAVEIMQTVERWGIIDPRLEVFRVAINVALHDLREAYWPYSNELMGVLPLDQPEGGTFPWTPPARDKIEAIERLLDDVRRAAGRLDSWTGDFQTEMQAALMRDLFPNDLPRRKTIDPHYLAVTLDEHERLISFFERETKWGQMVSDAEAEARRRLASRGEAAS